MKNIQLKFDSLVHLWQFKEQVKPNEITIITNELLLICKLTAQQVELAVSQFHAQVFKGMNTNSFNHNTH